MLMQPAIPTKKSATSKLWYAIWQHRSLYLMLLPGLLYFIVFRYGPLWYTQIAFKDFSPILGVEGSPWVGFKYILEFFNSYYFSQLMTNTLIISLAKLIFGLPLAIILAIALSETRLRFLRSSVQTITLF